MSEAEAFQQLKLHTVPHIHPTLSDAELQSVLAQYVLGDATYDSDDVYRAIADAWDLKCNKATDHHDTSVNGRLFSAEQVMKNCERQAQKYRRRLAVHVA